MGRYYIFTSEESSRQAGPIGHSTRTLEPRVSYVCNLGTSGREREKQAADPGTISLKKTKEEYYKRKKNPTLFDISYSAVTDTKTSSIIPPLSLPIFLDRLPSQRRRKISQMLYDEMTCIRFNWCKAEESLRGGGETTFTQTAVCTELECVEARPWFVAVCGCCVYFYRNHANKHGRERTTSAVPFLEAKEGGREIHVGRRRWRQRGGEYKLYSTWLYISST